MPLGNLPSARSSTGGGVEAIPTVSVDANGNPVYVAGASSTLGPGSDRSGTIPAAPQVTGSISGTVLTVTAVNSGQITVGMLLTGANLQPNTFVEAILTGTGGVGTYTVSPSQTAASGAITSSGAAKLVAAEYLARTDLSAQMQTTAETFFSENGVPARPNTPGSFRLGQYGAFAASTNKAIWVFGPGGTVYSGTEKP